MVLIKHGALQWGQLVVVAFTSPLEVTWWFSKFMAYHWFRFLSYETVTLYSRAKIEGHPQAHWPQIRGLTHGGNHCTQFVHELCDSTHNPCVCTNWTPRSPGLPHHLMKVSHALFLQLELMHGGRDNDEKSPVNSLERKNLILNDLTIHAACPALKTRAYYGRQSRTLKLCLKAPWLLVIHDGLVIRMYLLTIFMPCLLPAYSTSRVMISVILLHNLRPTNFHAFRQ